MVVIMKKAIKNGVDCCTGGDKKRMNRKIVTVTEDEIKILDEYLFSFNNSKVPFTQSPKLVLQNYAIKEKGKIIAGIKAVTYCWGILYIEMLFVNEEYRGQNFGSQLLNKVESEAKAIGSSLSHLDTFDFQAKDFYIKAGYEVFGILEDCPPGHKRYYLKKKL